MKDREEFVAKLEQSFSGSLLSEREKADLISAVLTRRPVLIVGPAGTSKDLVASTIIRAAGLGFQTLSCSASLRREDLFGDVDPLAVRKFGYRDDRSYVAGAIEKAHGGAILLKDLDNLPEKVAQALADFLDDGIVSLGQRESKVDVTIVATATGCEIDERLLDRFQVVQISYPENEAEEEKFIASQSSCSTAPPEYVPRLASKFLSRSRNHPDLESGASTRSGIRFVENVCACMDLAGREPDEDDLYNSCYASFTHSIRPNPFSWKTNRELAKSIFEDAVLSARSPPAKAPGKAGLLRKHYAVPVAVGLVISLALLGWFMASPRGGAPPVQTPQSNESGLNEAISPYLGNPSERNLSERGMEVEDVPTDLWQQIRQRIGPGMEENTTMIYDPDQDSLYITQGNRTLVVGNYTSYLLGRGDSGNELPGGGGRPSLFRDIPPALLVLSMIAIVFLSTFLFDYLDLGKSIRDSALMARIRGRLGISWEPLTRLYRNISEEVSPLARELEGKSLGETVKEISAARDELYAEKAKDQATLSDIADQVRRKPQRYPRLSSLLGRSDGGGTLSASQSGLIEDLGRHLAREGLIKSSREITFTHRVSRFLMSDVNERILKRVYDALQGVVHENLPPLPSSDVKDVRRYQRGDSYKDMAIRETIRDTIRMGRKNVGRDNLFVYEREPEKRELVIEGDADVVVVLDLSGSMAYGDKLWYAKQAIVVMTIIAERYGNGVGVVGFRDLSTEVAEFGSGRNVTIAKVANLLPRGGTNIAAGIRRGIDLLVGEVQPRKDEPKAERRGGRRKQMILLTDGDATHPKPKQFAAEYARRCARLATRQGIGISVVCIGNEDQDSEAGKSYNPELARQIAEIGGGSVFFVKDMRDLSSVFVSEIDRMMISVPAGPRTTSGAA